LPVWVKSPEGLTAQGYQFVVDSVNDFDSFVNGSSFPGNYYRKIVEIDSFVNFLLVNEITKNPELSGPRSAYMYKNVGGLITMGPVWDFDYAFGMDGGNLYYIPKSVDISKATGRFTTTKENKFVNFHNDPYFTALYKARWNEKYNSQIASMPAFIDAMYEKIKVSESLDAQRWFRSDNIDYAYEVGKLKTFWSTRVSYLNTEINK
jgi:hypothetical protein